MGDLPPASLHLVLYEQCCIHADDVSLHTAVMSARTESHLSSLNTTCFAPATIQILENVCELATLFFVIDISVCFCWIEVLACLLCKIMIAHCIYEGSWKRWKHYLWDLMKNLRYVNELRHSVLMMCPLYSVLVLWMNYQISSFSSLTFPLWSSTCPTQDTLQELAVKKKTLNHFEFSVSL